MAAQASGKDLDGELDGIGHDDDHLVAAAICGEGIGVGLKDRAIVHGQVVAVHDMPQAGGRGAPGRDHHDVGHHILRPRGHVDVGDALVERVDEVHPRAVGRGPWAALPDAPPVRPTS